MNGRPSVSPRSMTVTMPGCASSGERARLALETIDRVGGLEPAGMQQLDGDGAAQLLVVGLPDARHPAAPEQSLDAEASRKLLADHRLERTGPRRQRA